MYAWRTSLEKITVVDGGKFNAVIEFEKLHRFLVKL